MFDSAGQLTFPCPACGGFLTLRTFRATGPCPSCGTMLDVHLSVQPSATLGDMPTASGDSAGKNSRSADSAPSTTPLSVNPRASLRTLQAT